MRHNYLFTSRYSTIGLVVSWAPGRMTLGALFGGVVGAPPSA